MQRVKSRSLLLIAHSLMLAACSGDNAPEIEAVLLKDTLAQYRLRPDEDNRPKRISELMSEINLTDVPADFRKAYVAHIQAWRDAGAAMDSDDATLRSQASKSIKETFEAVERIALNHGATLVPKDLQQPQVNAARPAPARPQQPARRWLNLGRNSADCDWSYQTPMASVGPGIRFWIKAVCPQPQRIEVDARSITYVSMSARYYLNCQSEKLWLEHEELFDASGSRVRQFEPKVFGLGAGGPEMDAAGLGGEIIGQTSLLRGVYDAACR